MLKNDEDFLESQVQCWEPTKRFVANQSETAQSVTATVSLQNDGENTQTLPSSEKNKSLDGGPKLQILRDVPSPGGGK